MLILKRMKRLLNSRKETSTMRKPIFITFSLLLILILAACSESKTSTKKEMSDKEKQEEIVKVINEDIAQISKYEVEANQILASVSGENFKNDKELYDVLVNQVIPLYDKVVKGAKEIDPKTKELKTQTDKMEKASLIYQEALLLEKEALEKQDKSLIEKSNEKGLQYQEAIKEYHEGMENLTKKYDIDYEPTPLN
jgi:hypothetical protein